MIQTAGILYVVFILGVIVFQVCLIAGAPWGRLTQGGQHNGALPVKGRVAAGVSILLLAYMGAAIASASGFILSWPMWTAYVALALQALSTVANSMTPSRAERMLWAPVTVLMLAFAAVVVFIG